MLRERKQQQRDDITNGLVLDVDDADEDYKKKRSSSSCSRSRSYYATRCGVAILTFVWFVSLYVHPGDPFIKQVLEWTGFLITGTGISHGWGLSLYAAPPEISYEDAPIVSSIDIRTNLASVDVKSWISGDCLILFEEKNAMTIKGLDGWSRTYGKQFLLEENDQTIETCGCTHFLATPAERFHDTDLTIITSITSELSLIDTFQYSVRNHAQYCISNGCNFVLSLVQSSKLLGRSRKFSKYFALHDIMNTVRQDKIVCIMDADAFFAKWTSYKSMLMQEWPPNKEILVPSTNQLWINSGFMCLRNTEFSKQFTLRVLNVLYSSTKQIGFIRDQPAMWYVLASIWHEEGLLDSFQGEKCVFWSHCNPKNGPLECWHHCYWKSLRSVNPAWVTFNLRNVVNQVLSHVYIPSSESIHKICVSSCRNAFSHFTIGICSVMFSKNMCYPSSIDDNLSMCSSRGCMEQLKEGGGAWIMHTGYHHWHSDLFQCIPQKARDDLMVLC